MKKYPETITGTVFALLSVVGIGTIAIVSHQPFLFPSLGPTAFLLFYKPQVEISSPRNTILGHLVGVLCGFLGLVVFGLVGAESAFAGGVSVQYVGSAAIALALTSAIMFQWDIEHPPAGATTLIVSLGIMNTLPLLIIMMSAIVVLCFMGWLCNNLIGNRYPVWKPLPFPVPAKEGL